MRVLAVIPARAGSKSVPGKNLADVHGRPLISFIIEAARRAPRLDRVVVSTEDPEIAAVARRWGAEVPFQRPAELAFDEVSLIPVVQHAVEEMERLGFSADVVVSLQATSPFLTAEDIDAAVSKLERSGASAVVSVAPVAHEHPFWVKKLEGDRVLPFNEHTSESFLQRQDLPPAYIYDGGIFVRRRHLLEEWNGRDFALGGDVRAIVLGGARSIHVDDALDLELVRVVAAGRKLRRSVRLGERAIGEGEPAFLLAEVASAHQGDARRALAIARAAKDAGADGVKLQLFRASELVAPSDARFTTFQKIELSLAEWDRLLEEIAALGLPVLADVFDRPSLDLAERHRMAAYKIHSTDMENPELIRAAAATGKPLLFSTGGTELGIVERALAEARREGNEDAVLLHGVQNFPTRIEDAHLRFIASLKSAFGLPVGFLDHVDGGSPAARVLPALALAFGADLIEKHITLDRSEKGFDYESALDPEPFREMVELVRQAEKARGSAAPPSGESAAAYHRLMRRAILSRMPLRPGEPLKAEQVAFLRNERGLSPGEIDRILGRSARRAIAAWEPLEEELFE